MRIIKSALYVGPEGIHCYRYPGKSLRSHFSGLLPMAKALMAQVMAALFQ